MNRNSIPEIRYTDNTTQTKYPKASRKNFAPYQYHPESTEQEP